MVICRNASHRCQAKKGDTRNIGILSGDAQGGGTLDQKKRGKRKGEGGKRIKKGPKRQLRFFWFQKWHALKLRVLVEGALKR